MGWFCWQIEVFRKSGGFLGKKGERKREKGGENRVKNVKKCGFQSRSQKMVKKWPIGHHKNGISLAFRTSRGSGS